jgi:hypothetical protein
MLHTRWHIGVVEKKRVNNKRKESLLPYSWAATTKTYYMTPIATKEVRSMSITLKQRIQEENAVAWSSHNQIN